MTTRRKSSSTDIPRVDLLGQALASIAMAPFGRRSRVHRLNSFGPCSFVKREDELGFGVSGTKLRKYLSLLPEILKNKPDEAIVIGSPYSNHVLSLSQLLRENGVEPVLFLLGEPACKKQGNFLFSSLFADPKNVHWVPRNRWHAIESDAEAFVQERAKRNVNAQIVPKGANCRGALPGSLTLALDLLRNEQEAGLTFDHLLIDSGTGLTACALLLAFAFLNKNTKVHIVQIAGTEEEFHRVLEERKKEFEALVGQNIPSPTQFKLYTPSTAPSFGAVNTTLFKTIADIARKEGFLTDPVFTAKLFFEGRKIITEQQLKGNLLFIHSGGGLGLTGFQEEIAKVIEKSVCNNPFTL